MKTKSYILKMVFPQREVIVAKDLKNDREADKWAQLCIDICGKDEYGRKYLSVSLTRAVNFVPNQIK
jgi:hypothetical protein